MQSGSTPQAFLKLAPAASVRRALALFIYFWLRCHTGLVQKEKSQHGAYFCTD